MIPAKEKDQVLREWRRGKDDLPRPKQRSAKDVLDRLLPKLGLDQQVKQSELLAEWPKMVGPAVAKHARPEALRDGVLTVVVDNSMWLSELSRYQKPLLLKKVREQLGAKAVSDVVFRIDAR